MRKHIAVTIFLVLFILRLPQAFAGVTPVPSLKTTPRSTATPTPAQIELERIEKIKEMVASRVAELKLVEKRGIVGTVQNTSNTQINISDLHESLRSIDTDELTKFQGDLSSKSFGISDIKKGDLISAIGLYNKQTKRLLSRVVAKLKSPPILFFGTISEKDSKKYTIMIEEKDKTEKKTIDIETSTKVRLYTKKQTFQKSGFSKILEEQLVFVVGYEDPKKENVISALRIIQFED